jgi:uncharacterized membrane protein SirB2
LLEDRSTAVWLTRSAPALLVGIRPRPLDPRRVRAPHLVPTLLLLAAALALVDWLDAAPPRQFDPWGLTPLVGVLGLVAGAAVLMAWSSGRPLLARPLAALLACCVAVMLIALYAAMLFSSLEWTHAVAIGGAWILLVARRALDGLDPASRGWRRAGGAALGSAVLLAALVALPRLPVVEQHWLVTGSGQNGDWPAFDAEALMHAQPARIEAALAGLTPSRPGVTDLYVLGFAGDGSERVFAQEAEYAARLLSRRLGLGERALVLANDLRRPGYHPLATLSNLRQALSGLARVMDPEADILFLFLTSHGSEDHELLVHMPPLPLTQLGPAALRQALDDAGIRWRILLVSACYSGGFLDALSDSHTLVMTAARDDRSSFGCGPDSDITWFGRAYFAEAMNRTTDPIAAFAMARELVDEWERAEGHPASLPQYRGAPLAEAKLQAFVAATPPGPALAFEPEPGAGRALPARPH